MSIGKSFFDGPCSVIRCVKIPELCNHVRSCFSGGFPRHFLKAMDVKGACRDHKRFAAMDHESG